MNEQQTPPIAYETANPNQHQWTERAYRSLTDGTMTADIVRAGGVRRVTIAGPCPRCGHEVQFDQLLDAVAGEDGSLNALGSTSEKPDNYVKVVASCRCNEPHDKRPEGVTFGCGINFRVELWDAG